MEIEGYEFEDEFKPIAYHNNGYWETIEIELSTDMKAVRYREVSIGQGEHQYDRGIKFAELFNDSDGEDTYHEEQCFESDDKCKYYLINEKGKFIPCP